MFCISCRICKIAFNIGVGYKKCGCDNGRKSFEMDIKV